MNKFFKVIWNSVLNIWIVVGELAKRTVKAKSVGHSLTGNTQLNTVAKNGISHLFRKSLLALSIGSFSLFGVNPAQAVDITVTTQAALLTALSNGTYDKIILGADIALTQVLTVNMASHNVVIDGNGLYGLTVANTVVNGLAVSSGTGTLTLQNMSKISTANYYSMVYLTGVNTAVNVIYDNIGTLGTSQLAFMDTNGASTNSILTFGNILSDVVVNDRDQEIGEVNKVRYTGRFHVTHLGGGISFQNAGAAVNTATMDFLSGADVIINRTGSAASITNTGAYAFAYNFADNSSFELIANQNVLSGATNNRGITIGSYSSGSGFGDGAKIILRARATGGGVITGNAIDNATTNTTGINNGATGTADVIYNLATGSILNTTAAGILATKTGVANSSGIYISSGATMNVTTAGISASHAGNGNVVLENKATGTITAATGISATNTGTATINVANKGTINSTTAGIAVSSSATSGPSQTISVDNTGGTINASAGTGVNVLSNTLLNLVGGTITTTGIATGLTFAGTSGSHALTDLILNLNGTGAAFAKAAGINLALRHVTFNVTNGTGLTSLAGLTFAEGVNGRNTINVTGTGIGITAANTDVSALNPDALDINVSGAGTGINATGGGVDLSDSNLHINVTNSGGTGLQVGDGAVTTTTIGADAQINAAGATAINFTGTTAKTLTNNGTINGAVNFAGTAANTINNNAILNGTLTTGAGNDTLVLGSASQSNGAINLGAGNNNVTIQNGAQVSSITTGVGDDTFTINNMTEGSTYLGSLNAGTGTNTLNFNASTDTLAADTSLQGFTNINLANSLITLVSDTNIGSGVISVDGSSDLLFGSAFNGALNASLGHLVGGDGSAIINSGANVALSQSSNFAGDWQVKQSGTLTASNSNQLGTAAIALDGTLNLNGVAATNNALTGTGALNIANTVNSAFDFGSNTGTAFAGTVNMQNATFNLSGTNSGALNHATLIASADTSVAVGVGNQTIGNFTLNGGTIEFAAGSSITTDTLAVTNDSVVKVAPGVSTGGNLLDQDTGSSSQLINSTNALSVADLARLTLQDLAGNSLGNGADESVVQGGNTVAQALYNYALTSEGSGLSVTSTLTELELLLGQSLTLTSAGAVNADHNLLAKLTGVGNLIIGADNSEMTLTNATNDYTGTTTVNGGILNLGSDNALGVTSALNTALNTQTNLNGRIQTVGALTNAGTVTLGTGGVLNSTGTLTNSNILNLTGGTLNLAAGGTSTATGGLTGAGTLNINGGDLAISGANSGLSGQTLIAAGASASLSGAGTLGSSAINVLGDLNLNGANAAFANVLSGNGDINTNAAVTLTGTNSFSGAHHIGSAGALTVTQANNLGTSAATVNLDTATSHLVLNGLSGAIANALSGVANSTVDITNGADMSLTGTNSGFLGQYALAGDSKLTVASTNNLGASASIALAGAQDILALSGFNGTFGNTVTGLGTLQVTDSSNATLTSSNSVDNAVTIDITNATLNLADIALFDHALTGNGTLNVAKNDASTAFNFGAAVGGAFSGIVNLTNSIFALSADNTAALANATLKLSANNVTTVGTTDRTLHGLDLSGGTLIFDGAAPQSEASGVVTVTDLALNSGTVSVTGTDSWTNQNPVIAPNVSLLDQDRGDIMLALINAASVTGDVSGLDLMINGTSVTSGTQGVISSILQGGTAVANATHNYGLTSSNGSGGTGLYVNYSLSALELLTDDADALLLATDSSASSNKTLNALVSGVGGLQIDATNGALTLANGSNSYQGNTTVNAGELILGANGAFGATSLLDIASGASANINGHTQTVGALTNAGTVTLGTGGVLNSTGTLTNSNILNLTGGTLNLAAGGTSSATGGLTGAGTLNINGGDLAVSGANSGLSGQTLIAAGASASLNGTGTLGSSAINVLGDLNLNGANAAFANVLSGTGDINTNAAVTLTGTNSFSGAHHIGSAGALTVTQANNLGTSAATVNLDTATSHLVLNGLSGAIANALSGVANSTVDITNGADMSLTGTNSGFLGQYALAGDSKLTVAATNNLGASASIALAGAQDILALSGFNGTFGNTVTGLGTLQVTDSSDVTLTSSNGLGSSVTVDIADATVNLDDIALFNQSLTGNGTLNVAKNDASTAFNFGAAVGGAFSGIVNLTNSIFALSADNTAALANATLKLSANNVTTVGTTDRTLHGLDLSGGTLIFDGAAPQSEASGVVTVTDLALNSGTVSVTGTDSWTNQNPVIAPNVSLLDQDRGDIMLALINAASVTGDVSGLDLMINGTSVTSGTQGVISSILQGGTAVANATHNYGLTSSNGSGGTGLYVNYSLSALELLTDDADALLLATDSSASSNKTLNALVSGVGGLQIDATNGALTLANGSNSYQGNTTVNAGELILGANGAFGATSLLDIASGASANINGHTQTVGALTNAGTVTLGTGGVLNSTGTLTNSNILNIAGGTLNLAAGGTSTATGGLTGAGTLNINGGDLAVSGANSGLSGQTLIAAGASASLNGTGTLGSSAINVLGDLNLNGANAAFANVLSGNGDINTNAAVTLTGTNSFSGSHHIGSAGALTVTQANNLGTSAATVNLDTATSHLVLNGLSGAIANALSGVANSTVDITNGADMSLTGTNSGFLGQYALAGNSKLTVASTNNLGASASIALAGAQDILALSGFNGTFGNTVTGLGTLQVTDNSDVTLTSSNGLGSDVAVDIADATVNLADIALFNQTLTGNGTLNVAKNDASTAFNFGAAVGGAFSGIVNLTNTTFNIDGLNRTALTNSTLTLSSGSLASVADGVQNIGRLVTNGGTLLFNNLVDNAGVITSEGTLATSGIDTTGGGEVRVNLPTNVTPDLTGWTVMELDDGEIIVSLATGAATGTGNELTLSDASGNPLSAIVYQSVSNPGALSPAALGSFNYGLTTGKNFDGLYVNYGLTALELQSTGNDALILTATLANNGTQSNDISSQITGSGDLAFVSANDGSTASLSNSTNSYTGATWVRSGNLRLDADSALGQTSLLAMSTATTVDLNGAQQTVGQLTTETGSTLDFNSGNLTVTNGGQVDGALSGSGELSLTGGTLTITQGNSGFTGSTDIASGATAHLYQVQGLGTGAMTNNGLLNLDDTSGILLNSLAGSGNVQLTNSANVQLAADNSGYMGIFTTDAGTALTAYNAENLGGSSIANSGELILDTASVWDLTNSISGSGTLVKRGSGTVKIDSGTVSASLTTIEDGLLQLGSSAAISTLSVNESPLARSLAVTLASNVANLVSDVLITSTGSLGGYGQVTGNVENRGNLIMPNALTGGDFGTFTIDGNYTGDNGTVVFNTILAGDASITDRLVITGNTAGQSFVTVNNIGGNGARTSEGIKIIDVGGDSAGQFTLNGRAVAGAYEYFLYQGGVSSPADGDWYLRTQADDRRPEPASYTANLAAANTMFVSSLADRAGETLYTDIFTGEEKSTSLWLRNEGSHNRSRDDSGELKTQDNRYVMQLGGDVAQWSRNTQDLWRVGVMAGYANSSSSSVAQGTGYRSTGSANGYSLGVYGTWFEQGREETGVYVDSWLQYSWFNNEVSGEGLTTEKYDSKGFSASVESGYTFQVGQSEHQNYFIQPKAQMVWMGVKADSHTETNGTVVTGEGNNNIQTRLGVKAFISPIPKEDKGSTPTFKPYVEANWVHNTKDFGTTLDGMTVKQAGAGNVAELKVGVEGQINNKLNLWGNVGQQVGNNGYSDSSITLGVKYHF